MLLLWLLLLFITNAIRRTSAVFEVSIGHSYGEGLTRFQQAKSAGTARYYGYR